MKPSLVCLFALVVLFFVAPEKAVAQATSRPTSEQSLQELVKEVRQLRATLQRMNAAMYKGQVLLERLKLQQEQVNRIARDLSDIRENLSEIRGQQSRFKEFVSRLEPAVESGTRDRGELNDAKAQLEMLNQ